MKMKVHNFMLLAVALVLIFGTFLTLLNIYELQNLQSSNHLYPAPSFDHNGQHYKRPIAWVDGDKMESGYLNHVETVFSRIGYSIGNAESDWDVLWHHDYPFTRLKKSMKQLKPHQMVNHFPGTGYITNKMSLAKSKDIAYLPKTFHLPWDLKEFQAYIQDNKDGKWVKKNSNHRGVKIVNVQEIDPGTFEGFIQRYVDDPYLIDGRRFDIGVYAALLSIDPVRVYSYSTDWLVRFCQEPYYPFDESNRKSYVVVDDYLPLWEVPSLKHAYSNLGYSFKESLRHYFLTDGQNMTRLDQQIQEAMEQVFYSKIPQILKATSFYKSSSNFFELVRFDFVLDSKLNVYLLEVNMSPNLASNKFPPNKNLYQQVVYSFLHLVGLASPMQEIQAAHSSSLEEKDMLVSKRNIQVNAEQCLSEQCKDDCQNVCKLCQNCLTSKQKSFLRKAYQEHHNRLGWRRLIPRKFTSEPEAKRALVELAVNRSTSNSTSVLEEWFAHKCIQDNTWCL